MAMRNLLAVSARDSVNAPPTLDQIATTPASVSELSRDETVNLLTQCAAAQSILTAHWLATPDGSASATTPTEPDEMLTVAEAAKLLRCTPRWIWRQHARHKLKFVIQKSPRSLLCSNRGIERWLEARKAR
jgi:hypothetical protein